VVGRFLTVVSSREPPYREARGGGRVILFLGYRRSAIGPRQDLAAVWQEKVYMPVVAANRPRT